MTITEATKLVAVLKAAYPGATVNDETPTAYHLALDDLAYEQVMAAVKIAIRTMKFLPSAAELRNLVAEAETNLAPWEEAWGEIIATRSRFSIYIGPRWGNDGGRWSSPLVADALRHIGGYAAVCLMEREDESTLRAQFRDAYQRFRAAAVRDVQLGDAVLPAGERPALKEVS